MCRRLPLWGHRVRHPFLLRDRRLVRRWREKRRSRLDGRGGGRLSARCSSANCQYYATPSTGRKKCAEEYSTVEGITQKRTFQSLAISADRGFPLDFGLVGYNFPPAPVEGFSRTSGARSVLRNRWIRSELGSWRRSIGSRGEGGKERTWNIW